MYNFIVEVPVFQTNLYFDKKIRTKVELKKDALLAIYHGKDETSDIKL